MLETPTKTDAFVPTVNHLSTHPAYGKVDYGNVARFAGQTGRAAEDAGRTARKVPAEGTGEEVRIGVEFLGRWHILFVR
jgi:hypothetical protein